MNNLSIKLGKASDNSVKMIPIFSDVKSDTAILNKAIEKGVFKGEANEVYSYLPFEGERYIFVGFGEKKNLKLDNIRLAYFKAFNEATSKKEYEIDLDLVAFDDILNCVDSKEEFFNSTCCGHRHHSSCCGHEKHEKKNCHDTKVLIANEVLKAAVEGMYNSIYTFDKYKTDKKDPITINVHINTNSSEETLDEAKKIMEAILFSRELVNERAEYLYPETLANICVEELTKLGVNVEVYDEKKCEEMGLTAFLAVGRSSIHQPRFIVMEYMNDPDTEYVTGYVGKGITYDTGGYSLKPSTGMDTMFCDMGGAGSVIGAMKLIASMNLKTNVIGVVAACENTLSGSSYKPGDIIHSLSGKTIEVINTDAEGRITLADSMYYTTKKLKVDRVIDLATLTGACLIALGEFYTAAITNNQEFYDELSLHAKMNGERIWQLPNDDSFREFNKSKVADVINSGGRYGGTITAGQFIQNFVANDIPWIHLDIAGTAYLSKTEKYQKEGATGVMVKTLYSLLKK